MLSIRRLFKHRERPQIYDAIDGYAASFSRRFPDLCQARVDFLYRFVDEFNITSARDLTFARVCQCIDSRPYSFERERALTNLRSFLRYARNAAYCDIPERTLNMETIKRTVGRPPITKYDEEIRSMRQKGVPYREITRTLAAKYGRPFSMQSVWSWSKRRSRLSTPQS